MFWKHIIPEGESLWKLSKYLFDFTVKEMNQQYNFFLWNNLRNCASNMAQHCGGWPRTSIFWSVSLSVKPAATEIEGRKYFMAESNRLQWIRIGIDRYRWRHRRVVSTQLRSSSRLFVFLRFVGQFIPLWLWFFTWQKYMYSVYLYHSGTGKIFRTLIARRF